MVLVLHTSGWRSKCEVCGKESNEVSEALKVCASCVRERFQDARPFIERAHANVMKSHGLPPAPPRAADGVVCGDCGNACKIPEGGRGFCGLVENRGGRLVRRFGTREAGLLSWYYDPIPTNCVPAEFCAGSGGAGYPKWCRTPRGDIGFYNLSVFLGSCTYNCLFCQNFSFRDLTVEGRPV
ncbi:MAG: radical SAM protein, partial [Candidatus Hadarchaeales archaeon]